MPQSVAKLVTSLGVRTKAWTHQHHHRHLPKATHSPKFQTNTKTPRISSCEKGQKTKIGYPPTPNSRSTTHKTNHFRQQERKKRKSQLLSNTHLGFKQNKCNPSSSNTYAYTDNITSCKLRLGVCHHNILPHVRKTSQDKKEKLN